MSRAGNQICTPILQHHITDPPFPPKGFELCCVCGAELAELCSCALQSRESIEGSSSPLRALEHWPERGLTHKYTHQNAGFQGITLSELLTCTYCDCPDVRCRFNGEEAWKISVLNIAS